MKNHSIELLKSFFDLSFGQPLSVLKILANLRLLIRENMNRFKNENKRSI